MLLTKEIKLIIKRALQEDIGREDITTLFAIPYHFKTEGIIIAKEPGVLCGMAVARAAFKERDENIVFTAFKKDGDILKANDIIVKIKGDARSVLAAERVALNFLSLLSGVSTATKKFVDKIKGTRARILDTRKTTPNLRVLEKYAVRVGGGSNHRKALSDAILVKDNHLRAGKFIVNGKVDRIRLERSVSYLKKVSSVKVEIEVETLDEFESVIRHRPDIIMLDNFAVNNMKAAVKFRDRYYPKVKLEASGGVNFDNVRQIAQTGVDFISIGRITHSAAAVDFSLEIIDK